MYEPIKPQGGSKRVEWSAQVQEQALKRLRLLRADGTQGVQSSRGVFTRRKR